MALGRHSERGRHRRKWWTAHARWGPAHDTIAFRGGTRPGGAVRRRGRLDIGPDPADYVALHKTAAGTYRTAVGATRRPRTMNASLPASSTSRSPARRRRARRRGRAGRALAADAAAVRARPHQPLAGRGAATAGRSSTAATATRRRASCGNATSRATLARPPADAHRRHPLPPGPRRQRRLARRALRLPRGDDAGRVPDRARDRRPDVGLRARRHHARSSAGTACTPTHLAALEARGNAYRRGVPELPFSVRAHAGPATASRSAARDWRVIAGHGHSPEHASLHCAERGVLISGDMLLPRITHQRQRLAGRAGRRPAGPLPRLARARSRRCPPTRWCCPRTGCRSAASPRASAQLRDAPRGAPRRARGDAVAASGAPVSAAELVPVLFRRELDLQQRFFAMGEAIAHLNHLWRAGRLDAPRRRRRRAPLRAGLTVPHVRRRRTKEHHGHAPAKTAAPEVAAVPPYDPVALAESLASAAEKSAKLMGDFAARQAEAGKSLVADELGIAKAFMDLVAKMMANPLQARRVADEPVVGLHEPVAVVAACKMMGAHGRAGRRARARATSASRHEDWEDAFPVRLRQAVLPDRRAPHAPGGRRASRA